MSFHKAYLGKTKAELFGLAATKLGWLCQFYMLPAGCRIHWQHPSPPYSVGKKKSHSASGHWCSSSFSPRLTSQDPDLYPCLPETRICREIWAIAEAGAKLLPHFLLNLAANPSILWKAVVHSSLLSLENNIEPSIIVGCFFLYRKWKLSTTVIFFHAD